MGIEDGERFFSYLRSLYVVVLEFNVSLVFKILC